MTSLHFFERFILNEVNYVIVGDQYEIFSEEEGGGGGGGRIWGCATVLVAGEYIVLENICKEYYTVRTASSSVSSNQGLASRKR